MNGKYLPSIGRLKFQFHHRIVSLLTRFVQWYAKHGSIFQYLKKYSNISIIDTGKRMSKTSSQTSTTLDLASYLSDDVYHFKSI